MDFLTDELFTDVIGDEAEMLPETLAYIKHLIQPYMTVLDTATTVSSILAWIPQIFSHTVADAQEDADKLVRYLQAVNPDFKVETDDTSLDLLRDIKILIVKHFLTSLLEPAVTNMDEYSEHIIYPWDILFSIINRGVPPML